MFLLNEKVFFGIKKNIILEAYVGLQFLNLTLNFNKQKRKSYLPLAYE